MNWILNYLSVAIINGLSEVVYHFTFDVDNGSNSAAVSLMLLLFSLVGVGYFGGIASYIALVFFFSVKTLAFKVLVAAILGDRNFFNIVDFRRKSEVMTSKILQALYKIKKLITDKNLSAKTKARYLLAAAKNIRKTHRSTKIVSN